MFNAAAPLAVLKTMVAGLPGMQDTFTGIPQARDARVTASISLAGAPVVDKFTGMTQRHVRYTIILACRLDDDESGSETIIAGLVDAFQTAWLANRTLSNTCNSCTLDFSMADRPEYQMDAAQEQRTYPIIADCTQTQPFPLPQ